MTLWTIHEYKTGNDVNEFTFAGLHYHIIQVLDTRV